MSEYIPRLTGSLPEGVVHRIHASDDKMDEKKDSSHDHANRSRKSTGSILQKIPYTRLLLLAAALIAFFRFSSYTPQHQVHEPPPPIRTNFLQLVIPVHRLYDVDLCKTVLSAQVLNYPVPIIAPWGNSSDGTLVPKDKRMYHKTARTYAYMSTLPPVVEDALTIVLDGPDTWFQLRPEMLIQAYYRLIRRRNRELEQIYGPGVKEKVIFAAFGECGTNDTASLACSAIPEPPVDGAPKYLGHGAMIGPAKDVLAVVRRALNKLETTRNPPSKLLPVYGEIFGEQELHRQRRRPAQPLKQGRNRRTSKQEEPRAAPQVEIDPTAELGIGLDYENELGFSVAPESTMMVRQPSILLEELNAGIPPFWTVSGLETDLPPQNVTWADLDLLMPRTTALPPMIHLFPTKAMGGKDSTGYRRDWWPYLWLTQYARVLYTAAERLPATVVAHVEDGEGKETMFWNRQPSHNKAGAWLSDGRFFPFEQMCGAESVWPEVFRDELGPWRRTDWF